MEHPQALCTVCAAWSIAQQSRLCNGRSVLSLNLQVGVMLMATLVALNFLDTWGGCARCSLVSSMVHAKGGAMLRVAPQLVHITTSLQQMSVWHWCPPQHRPSARRRPGAT